MEELITLLQHQGLVQDPVESITNGEPQSLYRLRIPFSKRTAAWNTIRPLASHFDFLPIFVWDSDRFVEDYYASSSELTTTILDQATHIDPVALLCQYGHIDHYPSAAELTALVDELDKELVDHLRSIDYSEEDIFPLHEPWPPQPLAPQNIQQTLTQWEQPWCSGMKTQDLLLIPTSIPWHVPAYLRFLPGNAGIPIEVHVALLSYWHTRYTVEVIEVGRDSLHIMVQRPPKDQDEARATAWEHSVYCPDLDYQTIETRAIELFKGEAWSFWWD